MQEKPLCQILGFLRSVTAAPHIRVERIPVDLVEFTERYLKTGCLALGGEPHHTPPSGRKSVLIVPWRDMAFLQLSALKALVITFILNLKPNLSPTEGRKSFA